MKELKVAIHGENLRLTAVEEILNHQGVIFEAFEEEREYPCVISTIDRFKDINQNNVVLADEIVPMEEIIFALSGVLNNNFKEPEVNKYEFKLKEEIKKVFFEQNLPFIRKWFWPNFVKYCCVMTHDIDRMSIPPNSARKETPIVIKAIMRVVYYYQKYLLRRKKFEDYIDLILTLENRYNIKSSFYFFPDYSDVTYEEFVNLLNKLKKGNFEVGLHSNSTSQEQLEREKQELEKKFGGGIVGSRQHTLKFSVPKTWQYQEQLLDYDLSFYRNEEFGFRAGLCFPYRPLNTCSIIEIPTSFMDWTALHKKMNYDQIKVVLSKIFMQIESYNGCLVLNFHNEYFNKMTFPHIYKTFIDTLEYILNDYWVTTARECVTWWKRRESAKIDVQIENNKIIGSSSDKIPLIIEYKNGNISYLNAKGNFTIDL